MLMIRFRRDRNCGCADHEQWFVIALPPAAWLALLQEVRHG